MAERSTDTYAQSEKVCIGFARWEGRRNSS
jgi:hypothetical protein